MRKILLKDITIGEGMPKICVPLVGKTIEDIENELDHLSWDSVDMLEWRLDCFEDVEDLEAVVDIAKRISNEYPLLATFRTVFEGGKKTVAEAFYGKLYKCLIDKKAVDIIDLEYQRGAYVKELIQYAHNHGVYVVLSYHNFDQTPCEEELLLHLECMEELGGDVCKIAVMPNEEEDVLTVMHAALVWKKQNHVPFILLSMGIAGMITRICGEFMGSCITFARGIENSAPGQLSKEQIKEGLMWLHQK